MKCDVLLFLLCVAFCEGGRSCLSCSGVDGRYSCSHHIPCSENEVCYTHYYLTESGKDSFDYGCSLKHVCPTSVDAFVGKRSEGHHSLCYKCCNDSDLCNLDLQCNKVTPPTATSLPNECSDLKPIINSSGVYTIYPFGIRERPVRCSLHCRWAYMDGNDIIHAVTSSEHHALMINMSDFDAAEKYAEYNTFQVGDESREYRLYVNGYSGDARDDLTHHSGRMFSTYDKDNDNISSNCALAFKGAWWFHGCHHSDLNGEYLYGHHSLGGRGVYWAGFRGYGYSLKSTLMMIRNTST